MPHRLAYFRIKGNRAEIARGFPGKPSTLTDAGTRWAIRQFDVALDAVHDGEHCHDTPAGIGVARFGFRRKIPAERMRRVDANIEQRGAIERWTIAKKIVLYFERL
jgi:hypothetical protein